MSISKIRSAFDSKGCQAVLIVVGVLLGIGLIAPMMCHGPAPGAGGPEGGALAIGTVRGVTVSGQVAEAFVNRSREGLEQQALETGQSVEPDPVREFTYVTLGAQRALIAAANEVLAAQRKITLDQTRISAILESNWNEQMQEFRAQLVAGGKLKPEDPQTKFEEVATKEIGRPIGEIKAQYLQSMDRTLQDERLAPAARAELMQAALLQAAVEQTQATEAELKSSFDSLELERIEVGQKTDPQDQRMEKAEALAADLRAGKAVAEAIKAHTPGAKPNPVSFPRNILERIESYRPLLALKVGEVSEPMQDQGGVVVFRLKALKPNLPPDFEKSKPNLLNAFRREKAAKALNDEREAIEKEVKWKSPVYATAIELGKILGSQNPSDVEKMKGFAAEFLGEPSTDPIAERLRVLGRYVALNRVYTTLSPKDQAGARPDLIEAYLAVLNDVEGTKMRLELYRLMLDDDQAPEAAGQLLEAARVNTDFKPMNVAYHAQIRQALDLAKKNPKFGDEKDTLQAVQEELDRWTKDKATTEQEAREAAAEQARVQKELDELDRKQAEGQKQEGGSAPMPGGGSVEPAPQGGAESVNPAPTTGGGAGTTGQ